jgi:riboflavin kinase/FMN adenylyltransferase
MTATIGGFDGMHLGHRALIKKADKLIVIEKGSNLTPGHDRCDYTDLPCEFFDLRRIKHLTAQEFIEILKNSGIDEIVIGEDFRFGKNRSGDVTLLMKHFKIQIVKEVKINGIGVHSRIIREFIKHGNITEANRFLGHTYKIKGTQIRGQGLGSEKLVPTINIKLLKNYLLPKAGVYITLTNSMPSLTFLGIRSTDNNFSIETHVLTENGKWETENGELINIEFLKFLRENRKFDTLEELKDQINTDINFAKNYDFPTIDLN